MNETGCGSERDVILAVRSDHWTESLRMHVAGCSHCQATSQITAMMKGFMSEGARRSLPAHRLIWMKAQYARKQERLSLLDFAALAGMSFAGVAGLAALLFWKFPQFSKELLDAVGSALPDLKSVFAGGAPFGIILAVLAMVWLLTRDSFFAER